MWITTPFSVDNLTQLWKNSSINEKRLSFSLFHVAIIY